jgi:hypothetical protein
MKMPSDNRSFLYWATMAAVVVFAVFAYLIAIVLLPLATIVLLLAYFDRKLHPRSETPGILASLVMPAGMVLNVVALPIGICWLWMFGNTARPSLPERQQSE